MTRVVDPVPGPLADHPAPQDRMGRALDVGAVLALTIALIVAGEAAWARYVRPVLAARPVVVEDWMHHTTVGHSFGPSSAPVTLLWFGDYECPVCRDWHPRIAEIREAFGDTLRTVFRHLPLEYHAMAYPAARAAECASAQGEFLGFHEELYSDANWLRDGDFVRLARVVGLADLGSFEQCLTLPGPVAAIERDIRAATQVGATGTPTIMVNQFRITRYNADELVDLIRREASER